MIGLIGPSDSVAFAMTVAGDGGFANELIPRVYEGADQTTPLVRELDQSCEVILFTGQAPYSLVADSGGFNSDLQFISHSGIDLYRCIASVLIDFEGKMPKVSIDSIDTELALSTFLELGLPAPVVCPPQVSDGNLSDGAIDRIIEFHREEAKSGRTNLALTCLSEASSQLAAEGILVRRIEHTKATVFRALETARLSDQLNRSRGEQLAVALFQIDGRGSQKLDVYEGEAAKLGVHSELLELARKSGGRLEALERGEFSITTTRGVIEAAMRRQASSHSSLLRPLKIDPTLHVGVGIGASFSQAESNARHALGLSRIHSESHVVFPDGRVHSSRNTLATVALRLEDGFGSYSRLSQRLGFGPLSTKRLVDALKRMGTEPFSAQQLAEVYGVQVRSSRRFISSLVSEGFAKEVGAWSRLGAGRPQSIYKVDIRALADSLSAPRAAKVTKEEAVEG